MDQTTIDAIAQLLVLLPEHYVVNVMAALWVLGPLLHLVRAGLAKWAPAFSNHPAVVALDRALHFLAANSRRLEERANVVRQRRSMPPWAE